MNQIRRFNAYRDEDLWADDGDLCYFREAEHAIKAIQLRSDRLYELLVEMVHRNTATTIEQAKQIVDAELAEGD